MHGLCSYYGGVASKPQMGVACLGWARLGMSCHNLSPLRVVPPDRPRQKSLLHTVPPDRPQQSSCYRWSPPGPSVAGPSCFKQSPTAINGPPGGPSMAASNGPPLAESERALASRYTKVLQSMDSKECECKVNRSADNSKSKSAA